MAYNENLAHRLREKLASLNHIEEKEMMGGLAFMYNGKMCVGIIKDEMMCRIGPVQYEQALERPGCRQMDFTGRPLKGYVLVDDTAMKTNKDFDYWVNLCLAFNKDAKAAKKKK